MTQTQKIKQLTNNAQRRRESKAKAKALGVKVAWNENMPRSIVRKMLNSFTRCESCGDRLLLKNLDEHLRKAMLHSKPKATKKSKET